MHDKNYEGCIRDRQSSERAGVTGILSLKKWFGTGRTALARHFWWRGGVFSEEFGRFVDITLHTNIQLHIFQWILYSLHTIY